MKPYAFLLATVLGLSIILLSTVMILSPTPAILKKHFDSASAKSFSHYGVYAPLQNSGWSFPDNVSNNSDISWLPKFAFDSKNTGHAVWVDTSTISPTLMYAEKSPTGTWSEAYSLSTPAGGIPYVLVDHDDTVHVLSEIFEDEPLTSMIYHSYKTGSVWSVPYDVSREPDHTQLGMSTVVDSSNNLHVVWQRCTDANTYGCLSGHIGLYYSSKSPTGPWSIPQEIAPPPYDGSSVSLVVDNQGTLHLVGEYGSASGIFYMKKTSSGWSSPIIIPGSFCSLAYHPSLGIDSSGSVHVTWSCYLSRIFKSFIKYSTNEDGSWSTPFNIAGPSVHPFSQVVVDRSDNVHVAWVGGEVGYDMRTGTGTWSSPTILLTNTPPIDYQFDIEVDNNNTVQLAVQAEPDGIYLSDIYYLYKPAGSSWSSPINLSNSFDIDSAEEELKIAPDGTVHIMWREGDYTHNSIFYVSCSQNCSQPPPPFYSVSGNIYDSNNNPISGVTVTLNSGESFSANSTGFFTHNGLPSGTYILTPSKSGYTFSPVSRTVTIPPHATGQDFVGTLVQGSYSISGRISNNDGNALSGVIVSDDKGHSDVTDGDGQYELNGLGAGGYIVTLSKGGYSFSPSSPLVCLPPSKEHQEFTGVPAPVPTPEPPTGVYAISGHISAWDGIPMPCVEIELTTASFTKKAATDAAGFYQFTNLAPGTYQVSVMTSEAFEFTGGSKHAVDIVDRNQEYDFQEVQPASCTETVEGICIYFEPDKYYVAEVDLSKENIKLELANQVFDQQKGYFLLKTTEDFVKENSGAGDHGKVKYPYVAISGTAKKSFDVLFKYPHEYDPKYSPKWFIR